MQALACCPTNTPIQAFCAQLIGSPAGMGILSILAVEEGQLKVQLHYPNCLLQCTCATQSRASKRLSYCLVAVH